MLPVIHDGQPGCVRDGNVVDEELIAVAVGVLGEVRIVAADGDVGSAPGGAGLHEDPRESVERVLEREPVGAVQILGSDAADRLRVAELLVGDRSAGDLDSGHLDPNTGGGIL